jgi:uncharacterized protein
VKTVDEWKAALRAALKEAMRARQAPAVSVLRETLGAIDNAEAPDAAVALAVQAGVIAGGGAGLGAGEVPRKVLTPEAVSALIEREISERRDAAATWRSLGKADEAATLAAQVEVLLKLV